MRNQILRLLALYVFSACSVFAQDLQKDIARIKTEGFQNSKVSQLISDLSDLHGSRLTGSRQYYKAAEWAKQTMDTWGLSNVHFESFCNDCLGWEVHSFNVEMTSPVYAHIISYPYAWTLESNGVQEADVVWIENFKPLEKVKETWSGKLKGKLVLMGSVPKQNMLFDPLSVRRTEEGLSKQESSIFPFQEPIGKKSLPEMLKLFDEYFGSNDSFYQFLKEQGAIGIMETTDKFPGIVHPSGTYHHKQSSNKVLPYFAIAPEHFGILARLIEKKIVPKIKFSLDAETYLEPKNNVNIIAEIQGTDPKLKDEVVMIGAHFDSWHSGTGATDNGAGSAVMMEVMRILKTAHVKPKRTIRIGLWGGEEQGYLGSLAYAENHFGKLESGTRNSETEKISAYINMDNGAGMMRGIYLQGNEAARPVFTNMLEPYNYLDVNHLTINNTNFTDHDVFDYYNIPAFQIIQDELNYGTVTHHTTLDVLEYVPSQDLTTNATVIAGIVYQIAMNEGLMPRKK